MELDGSHRLLAELVEGGAPQSLTAEKAAVILRGIRPSTDVDVLRDFDLERAQVSSNAVNIASLFYLVPPCTAVFAWLLFGETFTGTALLGMVLTVGGVYLARK